MPLDLDVGAGLLEILVRPVHWAVRGTGVVLASAISFGRFQIEPFGGDPDWVAAEEGPVLTSLGATLIGSGFWLIVVAALLRPYF